MRIIALLALILTGCGADERQDFDPELRAVLDRYLSLAPDDGNLEQLVELRFGDTGSEKEGVCRTDWDEYGTGKKYGMERKIIIVPGEMRGRRFAVVMHELAHCLHDKEHSDDFNSLMYHDINGTDEYWDRNLDEKVRELF